MHKIAVLSFAGVLLGSALLLPFAGAGEPESKPFVPKIAAASNEAEQAIKRFRVPQGMTARVWAAEPMLANPVCFSFDEKGRCFVAETFRLHHGVTDNRGHMYWLDDDLACRTVADRIQLYHKHLKEKFGTYETDHDRVRLIEDSQGKGVADKASVFADGFRFAADGLGAGVLARKGSVYYTCIPHLWLLKDTKGAGKADVVKSLAEGFGVHVSFIGHDMHGLTIGPDGRLYFSLGDRGMNVTTKEGKNLVYPDTGAVMRCELDGSNLEVFASGLRNPQELAFDQYGNLFTCDNNSDSGDRARWVYLVEGSDSGWRIGYQYGSSLSDRGPWNAEKIWHLPHPDQPAYVVPPIAHIADGPSGLCYNPGGTALADRYAEHFFLSDFRGGAGNSGIRSFAVKPRGASFDLVDSQEFIWSILPTDCDFGPDGGFYISDWVDGWDLPGKGRIYRFADATAEKKPVVAEIKKMLAEGFEKRSPEELARLLEHVDKRIRQEAQFALAERGKPSVDTLIRVARESKNRVARLHAIWGLGQIGRKADRTALEPIVAWLSDSDAEVRAQSAQVLGDARPRSAGDKLMGLLKDPEPRVRAFAAQAVGHLHETRAVTGLLDMLRDNADKDGHLRHAGVMGLVGAANVKSLVAASTDQSPAVRMGVLLALRRMRSAEVGRFLDDADPRLVLEAARAIHDEPIGAALPKLAGLITRTGLPEMLLFRVINANFRLGTQENANAVAAFAGRPGASDKVRVEALKMLAEWDKPGRRDRVTGLTQDLGTRPASIPPTALRAFLPGIVSGPPAVRVEAARVAARFGIKELGPALIEVAYDATKPAGVRVESLQALQALKDSHLEEAMQRALKDQQPLVRNEGRRLLALVRPGEALAQLPDVLARGEIVERRGAVQLLADLKGADADKLLVGELDHLLTGELPAELHLDLLESAAKRNASDVKDRLARFESRRPKNDPLAVYRETLVGGDAEAGKHLFFNKAELSCLRCHKINGVGGEVGPELTGIGAKQKRDYLLESIVLPSKTIAKGFETVVLTLTNGKTIVGVLRQEDAREVQVMTAEGQLLKVAKDQIDERTTGKSAMPEDLIKHLSRQDLRNLVEFLAGLKDPPTPPKPEK
jgi:quinoprotein glucose dehydrogenase